MIQVYHNPRCGKSRAAIQLLEEKKIPFDTILYLKNPLNQKELKDLIKKLKYKSPLELVRTNETIWKEKYESQNLNNQQIIDAMVENPILIERPIVVNNDEAVVGRPTEKIEEIL